jgi:hypothetical protein
MVRETNVSALGRGRTGDLPLRRRLLYPLSYKGQTANLTGVSIGCYADSPVLDLKRT